MKEPISIKEIIAIVLKRGKGILLTALVFAVLAGGYQLSVQMKAAADPENSEESIEERYQDAVEKYENQVEKINESIKKNKEALKAQQEYNDTSVKMKLDPYNKYRCAILLAVTDIEEDAFSSTYEEEGTPVDYIITKIQQQYSLYWTYMDRENELTGHPYEGLAMKYLNEIVGFSVKEGGTLLINAYGETKEDAKAVAASVYAALQKIHHSVVKSTYDHELTILAESNRVEIDEDLEEYQTENLEKIESYNKKISTYKKQLSELEEPVREEGYSSATIVEQTVVWVVLGLVMGILLGCATVWMRYILRDGIESSRQAEAILGVPFFGSTAECGGIWTRMANAFVGERVWKDVEVARQFVDENMKTYLDDTESIAVVSTLNVQEEDTSIATVLKSMKNQGHAVQFVNCAESNPKAVAAMRECKHVILAERAGVSCRQPVLAVSEKAEQLNAKIEGFIFV